MGKQKQQVISRFFSSKPKPPASLPPPPHTDPTTSPPHPLPPSPLPKISAIVSFTPSKRRLSTLNSPCKSPKLSPHSPPSTSTTGGPSSFAPPPKKFPSEPIKYTPLEQQVVELKTKYPDVLLMVEVGYRIRFFGHDAETAARVLGIYAHMDHNFMTASIPTFRLHVHVRRLVNAGYKVGVVKQTETAAIKSHGSNRSGPFGRGLSALYTKATLQAAEDLAGIGEAGFGGGESRYLVCFVERSLDVLENSDFESRVEKEKSDSRIGFVGVEVSTGEVVYGEFDDDAMRSGLEAVILSLSPAELLLVDPLSNPTKKLLLAYSGPASNVRVEHMPQDCFEGGGALAEVVTLYEKMDGNGKSNTELEEDEEQSTNLWAAVEVIRNMPNLAVEALALTIRHLKQFGFERIICLGASFRPYSTKKEMSLSANALEQLEVLRNNSDGSEAGSLLQILNHTLTAYGSRLLRHWVTHPLCERSMISARLDAVAEIAESMGCYNPNPDVNELYTRDCGEEVMQPGFSCLLSSILTSLGKSPDLQRGITRIFYHTATASEFIAVMRAILYAAKQLQKLQTEEDCNDNMLYLNSVRSSLIRKLILTASSSTLVTRAAKLLSSLDEEAADRGDVQDLLIISDGRFPEVARARKAVQTAKEELDSLIVLYRKQLGLPNLEFFSVSGSTHLIELPVDRRVPLEWVKVNSTKKTVRYHPPEVLTALDWLTLVNEELTITCRTAWGNFLEGACKYYAEFQAAVQALAALDCLHSLAILSRNKNYVCPVLMKDEDPVQLHIINGRHPILETVLQDNFVPNDTNLHAEGEFCQIVTGPNMGGKSCYIRQVALIAIMAQVGSFVPASSAKLHALDGIYTRMGASDSIQRGRSTFLEELSEASHILDKSTSRSLVIIDELGRGTSTHDGVAIAHATLHYLLQEKRCLTLFVTHYPKIADIQREFPSSVGAYHVSYLTLGSDSDDRDVTYLYKLKAGISERSFGFKVAELAQVPPTCISHAALMAAKLEAVVSNRLRNRSMEREVGYRGDCTVEGLKYCTGGIEDLEELAAILKEIFSNLSVAVGGSDWMAFQSLVRARDRAKELIRARDPISR
ncbi:hypothetical protein SAY86_023472 [Trapa natans]|uniref:DNA mismatch repair protein n=1 Tax=Trapa natans TaxID=22666 RepID=A0AAN7R7W5_TRANT|nr:hypothetical protein SAY86_023472 [Trapa natans]